MKPASNSGSRTSAGASPLGDVAAVFLKLGTIAFGGPAAHLAFMEDEVVRRRRWLTHDELLDLIGAVNLIPGPNSTELAIHIGYRRAGWLGLLVGGACFIFPAALIVLACAVGYVRFGTLPQVQGLLYGVKPVVIAIIVRALFSLARRAVRNAVLAFLAVVALALTLFGVHELAVLFGAGMLLALLAPFVGNGPPETPSRDAPPEPSRRSDAADYRADHSPGSTGPTACVAPSLVTGVPLLCQQWRVGRPLLAEQWQMALGPVAGTGIASVSLWPLFGFFVKVGAVLFGSGYVLLAFLRADLVERWGWLTETQLLDAIAVGQFTPGPVFTTATFVGYLLAGPSGALVATAGIFLPAFCFVAISGPLVPHVRKSRIAGAFLDGVTVASLALMAAVTLHLGRAALIDATTIGLALVSLVLLVRFKVNSAWIVLGGALIGVAATL